MHGLLLVLRELPSASKKPFHRIQMAVTEGMCLPSLMKSCHHVRCRPHPFLALARLLGRQALPLAAVATSHVPEALALDALPPLHRVACCLVLPGALAHLSGRPGISHIGYCIEKRRRPRAGTEWSKRRKRLLPAVGRALGRRRGYATRHKKPRAQA